MTTQPEQTRCLVLARHPSDAGAGTSLHAAIAQRRWRVSAPEDVLSDPVAALAEAALRERIQQSRSAWGLQRIEAVALVIVEPADWPELEQLLAAASRWLPGITLWGWEEGSRLSGLGAPGGVSERVESRLGSPAPALRAGARVSQQSEPVPASDSEPQAAAAVDPEDRAADRMSLSSEELAMLLESADDHQPEQAR